MRILLLIFFCHSVFAGINCDSVQFFTTQSGLITDAKLNSDKNGLGTWQNKDGAVPYASWYSITDTSATYPNPVHCNGSVYTTTGTSWAVWTNRGNIGLEAMGFQLPGGSGGTFSNLCLRFFIRPALTNTTITANNLDHVEIDGNPFCICQEQTGNGLLRFIAHAQTANGGAMNLFSNKTYYVVIRDNATNKTCVISTYDASNGFAQVGSTSSGTMDSFGNVWWVRFQANYLDLGQIGGCTKINGISLSWVSPDEPDLGTPDTFINTFSNCVIRN